MLKKNRTKKKLYNHHIEQLEEEIKKGIGLFYKLSIFIFTVFFIVLFYFIVLVSTKPKSFSYVTDEIKYQLAVNLGDATIKQSHISFTKYGTLKLAVDDFRFFYLAPNSTEKQELLIPKVESEISLWRLILFQIKLNKLRIVNPEIVLNFDKSQESEEEIKPQEQTDALKIIFAALNSPKIPVKNFEIENANLVINSKNIKTKILLKKSQIKISIKNGVPTISANNSLNFYNNTPDVTFNSNCILEKDNFAKCNIILNSFFVASIADIHPTLNYLKQINTALNADASFIIENGTFDDLNFSGQALRGYFELPEFFEEKMNFKNLVVKGEFHKDLGVFNLSEIKADFDVNNPKYQNKAQFNMIFAISNIFDQANREFNFNIGLKNVPNNEVKKFWPKDLQASGARSWVIDHLKDGNIEQAYANFALKNNGLECELSKMDAGLNFVGSNLNYSADFPKITDISGVAKFSKKDMKITLNSGKVLGSKISQAQVSIDDFTKTKIILNISGQSKGSASDSLKHADNSQKFATIVEKYLNGNSVTNFDIRLPLIEKLSLKDAYIAVDSTINDLKNDYVKGGLVVTTKKDFGKNDFITKILLNGAEYSYKPLDIDKKRGVESSLDFVISFADSTKIAFKNINLWKKDALENGGKGQRLSKISGNLIFKLGEIAPINVNIKNENFGWNNYNFSYIASANAKKISIKGKALNLNSLINEKFFAASGNKNQKLDVDIILSTLLLADNKLIRSFYLSLDCANSFCSKGVVRGNYSQNQYLNLQINKKPNENAADVTGRISDIGYLAEALAISDKVLGGDAKIKMVHKVINNQFALGGDIEIDNEITIFETVAVKKLARDNLFSKIKDKIFSSEKITFNSVKINLDLNSYVLNLNSLLANNYKIGITAKGMMNFKDNSYDIKGMIVPGFIINNLFGIGNIPIIGNVVSGLLTGGEGGGLFGIRYQYYKNRNDQEAKFETNKVSAFVPTTIRNLFDAI